MLMIEQIGNKTGVSHGSVQCILNEYLSLQRMRVHMCACMCVQSCVHVRVCAHLWMISVRNRPLTSEIINGDASWILAYSPVMKYQSSEWNTNMLSPKEKVASYNISAEGHFLTTLCVTPWVCPCRSYSDFHVFTSKLWSVGEMPFGRGSHKKEKLLILHHDFGSCHTCLIQQLSMQTRIPFAIPATMFCKSYPLWLVAHRLKIVLKSICFVFVESHRHTTRGVFQQRQDCWSKYMCVCVCVHTHTRSCAPAVWGVTRLGFVHILVTTSYAWVPESVDPPRKILML